MLHFSKSVQMKKQTHLLWPEGKETLSELYFWVNYSFKELKHFKWQTTKLQRMLVIINRLSSVGLEANIDIFTVIILGVNKPLHNPQTKYKIHSSYLNINVKNVQASWVVL